MAPKVSDAQLQSTEKRFADMANAVYSKVMDLNVNMSTVATSVTGLMNLRNQLLTLYGVAPDPKWNPNAQTAAAAPAQVAGKPLFKAPTAGTISQGFAAAGSENLKGKLNQMVAKKAKKPMTKEDLVYTTIEDPSGGGYTSTLISPLLNAEYSSPAPCPGKKDAEAAAAKAALLAEFPEAMAPVAAAPAQQGQKRKAGAEVELQGKQLVGFQMQMLLGRSCTKEDIIYDSVEVAGSDPKTYKSTVSFPTYNQAKITGAPAPSKKEAEANAATVAAKRFEKAVAPKIEEHKAKKAKKNQEGLAKLKEAHAAKKAAAATA